MTIHPDDDDVSPPTLVDYESSPLSRGEYVTAIIHLYRGEISRANAWRLRLDQTTNWAVFTTATALGFAFSDPQTSHFSLQFANLLLVVLLLFEARRFRFFDVWRSRIRKIETNFYAPILRRDPHSREEDWGLIVAADLHEPHFHLTRLQAVRLRLMKNYLPIFGVVAAAWVIKLIAHPTTAHSLDEVVARFEIGRVPAAVAIVAIATLYAALLAVIAFARVRTRHRDDWDIGESIDVVDR